MLCPEVWKFTAPKINTYSKTGTYVKNEKIAVGKTITKNHFNKMVSIVLPGCEIIPVSIQEVISTGDYYLVRNLNLRELVRKDFIEAFIKRGKFTGISSEPAVLNDFGNSIFVTPDGKLIISVPKDLYQELGLEGHSVGQSKERFEIIIDLKNSNFLKQPKLYDRIKKALSCPEIEPFDFQITWNSLDSNICPSSVAKFFNDSGYKIEQHSIQFQSNSTNKLKIPKGLFSKNHLDTEVAHDAVEYFAYIMLQCEANAGEEINSYRPSFNLSFDDEDDYSNGSLILHFNGLMSSDFVANLLEAARLRAKSLIFTVHGKDTVPAKGTRDQITSVTFKNENYFLFST